MCAKGKSLTQVRVHNLTYARARIEQADDDAVRSDYNRASELACARASDVASAIKTQPQQQVSWVNPLCVCVCV